MRKLKIWNHNKTSSLDLNSNKYLVDDISGFGTGYKLVGEGNAIQDIELEFENITLNINFGVHDNAYNCYKEFMDFIMLNGKNKLILEYDYNGLPRYCDLHLQSAPKTQKNNFNIISETFVFKRLTPWYEIVEVIAPGNGSPYGLDIINNHIIPVSLNFEIALGIGTVNLVLTKLGVEVDRLVVDLKTGYTLIVDSEKKQATFNKTGEIISAYDNINHLYSSFMHVGTGSFVLQDSQGIPLKIKYKKWVAD